jgi:RND family efflux transporter MFP subunit
VDAARARVRAAQANLARSQADYGDTLLTSPINGTVTHVNIKTGESLPAGGAISVLGDSPFRVEMFVSEIDVPKLALTQSGSVELDAFRGTRMKLTLSEVGSAPTDVDGVSKYGVKLDFLHDHPELRIGMTGDAEIVTGMRSSALSVPRRAVLEDEPGKSYVRILAADGKTVEQRPVTLGMEGEGGEVEVLSGVEEGETVVVLIKK